MARVVIVSNRVPTPGAEGPAAGGLAVALADAIKKGDLWFGWSGGIAEKTSSDATVVTAKGVDYATIDLSDADYRHFYVAYANSTLWPLFHFRPGMVTFERADYEAYVDVNRSFAHALKTLLKPDDLIWVHDYHLIPLARILRKLGVTNRIGFFLHVPFVPASLLETLPNAIETLKELCNYDVVGFQTERHTGDFRDCLRRMMNLDVTPGEPVIVKGHSVLPLACPIGIDAEGFAKIAVRAAKNKDTKRLIDSLVGRAFIIGSRYIIRSVLTREGLLGNPYVLVLIAACAMLQLAYVHASPLQAIFHSAHLTVGEWLRVGLVGVLVFTIAEVEKAVIRTFSGTSAVALTSRRVRCSDSARNEENQR